MRQLLLNPYVLFAGGALLLAAEPALWLVSTWTEAGYNPEGLGAALAVVGLAAWSLTSEQLPDSPSSRRYALTLLAASAVVRALGQVLRVNVIGAVTLAVDVYALSVFAGLHHRRRALSPLWLAALFALSLPLERVLQRALGYGLQQVSADGACALLAWLGQPVACLGTRILLAGQDVLVDLPCSGARGLVILLTLFCAAAALARPTLPRALVGLGVTLLAALLVNVLRIALLALGLAAGLPMMEAPYHEGLGLLTLALGAAAVAGWGVLAFAAAAPAEPARPSALELPRLPPIAGLGFVAVAALIVSLPARPLDVARPVTLPPLPASIGEHAAQILPLSATERRYFTRYGGNAARAAYGEYGLLVVSTSAPLRHLHAPDECLRSAGHQVRYVAAEHGLLPTSVYRSTDPQGRSYRIAVSYVSEHGEVAHSVAEATWRWLRHPGTRWTMVQRISPWGAPAAAGQDWDLAVARALELPLTPSPAPAVHFAVAI